MSKQKTNRMGVISRGIKTPIIQPGDNLEEIVISSVMEATGEFQDGDIIGVTEAVVAISQGNFATAEDIQTDIMNKFPGATELAIVDPIQSRNRFMEVLKAIAGTPQLKKLYIFMTYPCDEVGNRFISDEAIMDSDINPYKDVLDVKTFYKKFGYPKHPFTGKNYIVEYQAACMGKAEIVLCNDFSKVPEYCKDVLVCSIHRREMTKRIVSRSGANRVFTMADILSEAVNGSGYNEKFGLYGTNAMAGGKLKLMPRDCFDFSRSIKAKVKERHGKDVEVFVYGDGAFKDPVGGIWELADPQTTLGATNGLVGTPKEVKLKYLASANEGKSSKEIEKIVAKEKAERVASGDVTSNASLGTTPRQITDLLASLADLTTGSGDRQTPVVLISGYLR